MPATKPYKADKYGIKNAVNLFNTIVLDVSKLAVIKGEAAAQHREANK